MKTLFEFDEKSMDYESFANKLIEVQGLDKDEIDSISEILEEDYDTGLTGRYITSEGLVFGLPLCSYNCQYSIESVDENMATVSFSLIAGDVDVELNFADDATIDYLIKEVLKNKDLVSHINWLIDQIELEDNYNIRVDKKATFNKNIKDIDGMLEEAFEDEIFPEIQAYRNSLNED